jgi:hypothetical protein
VGVGRRKGRIALSESCERGARGRLTPTQTPTQGKQEDNHASYRFMAGIRLRIAFVMMLCSNDNGNINGGLNGIVCNSDSSKDRT